MSSLREQYILDREVTRAKVLNTFERDSVPQDMIDKYFTCYDNETEIGLEIAKWLDENRKHIADT